MFIRRAQKIENTIKRSFEKSLPEGTQIGSDFDPLTGQMNINSVNNNLGFVQTASAYLDEKGNAKSYSLNAMRDTRLNGNLDLGAFWHVNLKGKRGFYKHFRAQEKYARKHSVKYSSLTSRAIEVDGGSALANFLDDLPGANNSSFVRVTIDGIGLNVIYESM